MVLEQTTLIKLKTSSTATATTETKAKEDKGTYKDRTLTVPDGVLKITEFQKGTSFDGKPIFMYYLI